MASNTSCEITFAEGQARLGSVYDGLINIISRSDFDDDLKRELEITFPKYRDNLVNRRKDLMRTDSAIVIAGETNAGKTTLINKIIGKNLLTSNHRKNSKTKGLRLCTKDDRTIKEIPIQKSSDLRKTLQKFTDKESKEVPPECHYVDVLFPIEILKGDVIIVDTPGLNEEKKVREMLEEYLPNALSFIFVLNVGNDGGVQCDRIPKLFKLIRDKKERGDLPCFDETEALFLVNKWDTISIPEEIVDTDEELDEVKIGERNTKHREEEYNKIWNEVLKKIRNVWPFFTNKENAFQISLASEGNSPEFRRFFEILKKMVKGNENKRMKQHLCFLIEFAHNAERGIQARLQVIALSEEQCAEKIRRSEESLTIIETACNQCKEQFIEDIRRIVEKLSEDLAKDIKTETWKNEALNPTSSNPDERKKPIKDVPIKELGSEVKARVDEMIVKWAKDGKFREEIERKETEIQEKFIEMQKKLAKIEGNLTGSSSTDDSDSNVPLVVGIATSPLWVPLALVAGVLMLAIVIVLSPWLFIKSIFSRREKNKLELIDQTFSQYIKSFDDKKIHDILTKLSEPLKQHVMDCFDKYLPRHFSSLRKIVLHIKSNERQINERKNIFIRLNATFSSVRVLLRELRRDFHLD